MQLNSTIPYWDPQYIYFPTVGLNLTTEQKDATGDHGVRKLCLKNELSSFAEILGPERTRDKLIPCLLSQYHNKSAEVKISFTEELGGFTSLVGGSEYVYCLFPLLENLAVDDVILVRKNAVNSLRRLCADLSPSDVETKLFPFIERLKSSALFAARETACCLISDCYPRSGEEIREELRKSFRKLSWDIPYVREAVADSLGGFSKVIEEGHMNNYIVLIFKQLACDPSTSVRGKTVNAGIEVGSFLSPERVREDILPLFKILAKDTSPTVRSEVAKKVPALQKVVGKDFSTVEIVPMFQALLNDLDPGVRAASSKEIINFCINLENRERKKVILKTILPEVLKLVDDGDDKVRIELASVVMDLCPMFCKKDVSKFLWQIFLLLLGDSSKDVRFSLLSNLSGLKNFITVRQFTLQVVQIVKHLATDKSWRVRLETVECLLQIATKLEDTFFGKNICNVCLDLLVDPAFAVREEMAIVLGKIVCNFGSDWATDNILQDILEISKVDRYQNRLSCISCIRYLAEPCGLEITTIIMLPTLLALSKDRIPNVRFNVAKTLQKISYLIERTALETQVIPVLNKLKEDSDMDVIIFAEEAVTSITEILAVLEVI